ncbi:MAG: DUF4230 domain-containing protein [Clostridiaceae bacterium]|jgi:hypothetical protein|nr:DUF4230 domain-containing protein [Clostridiaceae bacterium]
MKIRKIIALFLVLLLSFTLVSCDKTESKLMTMKLQVSQMKAICELATLEVYYHNVAKYKMEDAEGILFWKKDRHFWIEYSGIVKLGIDASLVAIEVKDDAVAITVPKARVLDKKVDPQSLNKESFIVEKDSAKIRGEDETKAFEEAQENMVLAASKDTALLASAQQRAQILLEEYIKNIGKAVGKEYSIEWKYLDTDGDTSKNIDKESNES